MVSDVMMMIVDYIQSIGIFIDMRTLTPTILLDGKNMIGMTMMMMMDAYMRSWCRIRPFVIEVSDFTFNVLPLWSLMRGQSLNRAFSRAIWSIMAVTTSVSPSVIISLQVKLINMAKFLTAESEVPNASCR